MRSWLPAVLLLSGCGRWYFDPVTDSSGGGDGSLEAIDAPFCVYTFCDDFNRITPVTTGWSGNTRTNDPVQEIESSQYHVVVNDITDRATLEKLFPMVPSKLTIGFSINYTNATPTTPPDQEIDLVRARWDTLPVGTCTSYGFYFVRDGTGPFNLQETYQGCGANINTPIQTLDNQGPHDVKLTIAFGPPTRIQVHLDGVMVLDKAAMHDAAPSAVTFQVGADVVRNVVATWDFRYDNVYVDVE